MQQAEQVGEEEMPSCKSWCKYTTGFHEAVSPINQQRSNDSTPQETCARDQGTRREVVDVGKKRKIVGGHEDLCERRLTLAAGTYNLAVRRILETLV